jgi:hypothetical protein
MKYRVLVRRAFGLGLGIMALAAGSAQAATTVTSPVDTSACTAGAMTQPFASAKDNHWYTLMPGESAGNFDGTGWTLTGGAQLITTTLADGSTGTVLDMPSGSTAVSPVMCVTSAYPTARTLVRNVTGGDGVHFRVAYEGTKTWAQPQETGQFHGNGHAAWTLSGNVNVHPANNVTGWQPVQFTLVAGGHDSEFQVYNFYVDPHCFW